MIRNDEWGAHRDEALMRQPALLCELGKSADSTALVAAMKKRYPQAGFGIALEIGAKMAKGEMKWD